MTPTQSRTRRAAPAAQDVFRSAFNSLTAPTAILDEAGRFIAANPSWRTFAADAGLDVANLSAGDDYLELCAAAFGLGIAADFAAGLRAMQRGELDTFVLEASLQSPHETRWYLGRVTRALGEGPAYIIVVHENITERKRLEARLHESEEKFTHLFDNSVMGKTITQPEGAMRANKAFCDMLGYSPEEMRSLTWQAITHSDDMNTSLAAVQAMFNGKTDSARLIKRYLHKDGSSIWAEVGASLRRDQGGRPLELMTVVNDISALIQTQEDLLRANVELNKAQSFAHLGSWTWHIRSNRVEWTDEMYRIFGLSREAFDGDLNEVVGTAIHPDDRAAVEQANRAVIEEGHPIPLEYRIIHPDGSIHIVWAEAGELICDDSGAPLYLRGTVQEITERVQAEESLRLQSAALEAAANAIIITDRAGLIRWANPAFEQLTGYTTPEVIGKDPKDLVNSGKQPQEFYIDMWNTIMAGRVWRNLIVNRRKDGQLYTEDMTITPVHTKGQEISHFVAIKQDVSEQARREREREAMAKVAAALRQAQTRSETIEIILSRLVNLLGIDGAFFAANDDATGEVTVEAAVDETGQPFSGWRLPPGENVLRQVIETGRPFSGPSAEAGVAHWSAAFSDHTVACVPLPAQDYTVGALVVFRKTLIANGEFHLLTAIAEMAGASIHRATLHEQTSRRLERISVLRAIDLAISSSLDLNVTLNILVGQITTTLHVDAADILLFDPDVNRLSYAAGEGFFSQVIQDTRLRMGKSYAGASAARRKSVHMTKAQLEAGDQSFFKFCLQEGFVEYYCLPLMNKGVVRGVLEIYHRREQPAKLEWLHFLETLAGQAVIAMENARLFEESLRSNQELMAAYDKTIEGWSRAMDLRDKETEGHTQRVTEMSLNLARALGFSDGDLVNIRRGALLHDIGKIGIPDEILHKAGPLSADEMALMRRHPGYAFEMLTPIEYLQPALDIPYYHHEKWDGTGYPNGLAGEHIPLAARLFAVVDVYDALISDRPYRPAWPHAQAIAYLHEQAGLHFDPDIVDVFLHLLISGNEEEEVAL